MSECQAVPAAKIFQPDQTICLLFASCISNFSEKHQSGAKRQIIEREEQLRMREEKLRARERMVEAEKAALNAQLRKCVTSDSRHPCLQHPY
jgi:hypothetical protein